MFSKSCTDLKLGMTKPFQTERSRTLPLRPYPELRLKETESCFSFEVRIFFYCFSSLLLHFKIILSVLAMRIEGECCPNIQSRSKLKVRRTERIKLSLQHTLRSDATELPEIQDELAPQHFSKTLHLPLLLVSLENRLGFS